MDSFYNGDNYVGQYKFGKIFILHKENHVGMVNILQVMEAAIQETFWME